MTDRADLEKRMALAIDGQVTWPELDKKQRCNRCRWFDRDELTAAQKAKGLGRCGEVRKHTGKAGRLFVGVRGHACRYWKWK